MLIGKAFAALGQAPYGPVLLGLPQDLLSSRFIPSPLLAEVVQAVPRRGEPRIDNAVAAIESAERPVILVDDYLLRSPAAEDDLACFATRLGAPVLQVAYRRGPMFFQQVQTTSVPTSLGLYDPGDARHRGLVEAADLLITVEDRNMYPRVVVLTVRLNDDGDEAPRR
jgi:acetolactate synthase-1/2/3 large subunit